MSELTADYVALLTSVKERIRAAQYEALRAVNKELVVMYWDIGKIIAERQEAKGWGTSVVEQLVRDIRIEFPGIGGFSARNLWRMRDFYLTYKDNTKLPPLVAEIGWSHNIIILEKCKDDLEREFYLRMTRKFGWTKNVLIHHGANTASGLGRSLNRKPILSDAVTGTGRAIVGEHRMSERIHCEVRES